MDDMIYRQAAIDALCIVGCGSKYCGISCEEVMAIETLPSAQPDEKLEKCRFEYINACRIVTFPTPDTTKKDISDAYAVIKALQPIFGDVTF